MKVLIAGDFLDQLVDALAGRGDELVVIESNHELTLDFMKKFNFELAIFCCYELVVKSDIVESIHCINIHFSILPYGRGPEPLLASWINGEPIGITIHEMTRDVDCGPIIVQTECPMGADDVSLESSFDFLIETSANLMMNWWEVIKNKTYTPIQQSGEGSFHTYKQVEPIFDLAVKYGKLPVSQLLKQISAEHPDFRLKNM